MKRALIAWLMLAPAASLAQSGEARAISLEEAIRLARISSPQIVQAKGQIESSDAAIRSARGAYLPSLNMNLGSNRQGGETFFQGQLVPFRGDPWNFSRGISSNLELFDKGRRSNNLRSARASLAAAESNERLQAYRVALDVKQQFFVILAARESRAAAEAQLAQAQEQLKVASARVTAGVANLSDSLRSVIQVGNARLAILTAENNLRVANNTLTRLVATPYVVTAASEEGQPIPTVTVDSSTVAAWLEDAPIIVQARHDVAAAGASFRAARAPYWPTLTSNFNYSGSKTDDGFNPVGTYATQYAMRLTLSYPIFNGFQREENVTRANVAERNAQAALRDARFQVSQQYAQLMGLLRLAEARIDIQLASVAAGDEDLRVQNQRYTLGAGTLLDVLTSQLTLNQARQALIQARFDARSAKAQIEALVGRDLP